MDFTFTPPVDIAAFAHYRGAMRVCFLLKVRAERLEEYRERHADVWPEMLEALRETDGTITRCFCGRTACWSVISKRPILFGLVPR